MYFLAVLSLDGYLLAPRRPQFSLSFDTYDTWCLLLPRSGSFSYELGEHRGIARFGDIVICPPGGTLGRRMRTPTSFFHARFRIPFIEERRRGTDLEPPIGRTRVRDVELEPPIGRTRIRDLEQKRAIGRTQVRNLEQKRAIGRTQVRDLELKPPIGRKRIRDLELEPPIGCSRIRDLERLRSDLRLLETAQSHPDLVAVHVVTDLILMMLRDRNHAPEDELVRRATTFILDNFTSPDLSLGDLAAALGISAAQLSRRFRAARGVTPVAYLRNVRLQKARELLTETNDTLQAVAEQSGYRSAFYLSRVFTTQTGQPPSTYRHTSRV